MFNQLAKVSLYSKILLSFLAVMLVLAAPTLISMSQTQKTQNILNQLLSNDIPILEDSLKLLNSLNTTTADLSGYMATSKEFFNTDRDFQWEQNIESIKRELQQTLHLTEGDDAIEKFRELETKMAMLRSEQDKIEDLFATDKKQANELFIEDIEKLAIPIQNQIESMVINANIDMEQHIKSITESMWLLSVMEWGFLLAGVIAGLILSNWLAKGIAAPVMELATATESLAKGNLNIDVNTSGCVEISNLSSSINRMILTMGDITKTAKLVAEGDYSSSLKPRSEHDELVFALTDMTSKLKDNQKFYTEQSWLQEGSSKLLLTVSQNTQLSSLCKQVLLEMAQYLEAGIGALYLFDQTTKTLKLNATYAYTERDMLANEFALGKGIVGQVGLEKEPILLKNIKRTDVVITTGLTEEPPVNTFTFPLVDKNELIGVIELGFHETLSPLKINYIKNIVPLISSNIRASDQMALTERLLSEQRALAEELQKQQQELKVANEELATQAEELRSSEEELRVRDEEQRTLNQSLEERNGLLQKQSDELKFAQQDLLEQAKQLQMSSKYKSEFLANMSHELRTPLNSLLLLSKMLADNKEKNLSDDQIESLQVIHRSGNELLQLINDVLDIAKVEAGKVDIHHSKFKISSFIKNLRSDFQAVFQDKNIEFIVDVDSDVDDEICIDEKRLKQIVKNLLSNALKFTEQGSVKLFVHNPAKDVVFANKDLKRKNCIAWSVIDTGIGIPEDKHKDVFQTFYQGDGALNRKYTGTGLGLSISAELAKLMGGEITLKSTEGKGSEFTLYIPKLVNNSKTISDKTVAVKEEAQVPAFSDSSKKKNTTAEKTLLVIEDDVQFAKILTDVCRKKGFSCKHAATGQEGLDIAFSEKPSCILLDIHLPDMSGLMIADRLKDNKNTRDIPIHFISGSEKTDEVMKHGAASYLIKPITIEKLDLAIQSVSHSINDNIKKLLIVEDNDTLRKQVKRSYEEKSIQVVDVGTGKEALKQLESGTFDCMVLDLGLPDISGFEILEHIQNNKDLNHPAVIVYTGHELTEAEHELLRKYSENIIIKGKVSLERLLDETTLFLHQMQKTSSMSELIDGENGIEYNKKLNGKKVLLVDDDMRNTFALAKILKQHGLDTAIAPNGKVAIEMLNKDEAFDGILMDIMMPVMDGFEAIETIRKDKQFDDLPIIALTAKAMASDREKCLSLGANDYLAKPIDIDQLVILLRACLCQ